MSNKVSAFQLTRLHGRPKWTRKGNHRALRRHPVLGRVLAPLAGPRVAMWSSTLIFSRSSVFLSFVCPPRPTSRPSRRSLSSRNKKLSRNFIMCISPSSRAQRDWHFNYGSGSGSGFGQNFGIGSGSGSGLKMALGFFGIYFYFWSNRNLVNLVNFGSNTTFVFPLVF
jgi:hypothetical protein